VNPTTKIWLVVLAMFVGFACASQAVAQLADPIPGGIPKGTVSVRLKPIATGLVAPNYLTHAGDGSDRLFIVDQPGQIRLVNNGVLQAQPYLNVNSLLVTLSPNFDERGLLGLAFHPNFENAGQPGHGKFYTYTSEPVVSPDTADFTVPINAGTSFNNQAVLREWTVDPLLNQITGDLNTLSRQLLRVNDPQSNHNAGMVTFGPDGLLYFSIGDGGSSNDNANGHTAGIGNGQDTTNIFGNILRIDPLGTNSANGEYGIPATNPFVSDPNALDEIYAYGLRNPFRFSFDVDPATGLTTPQTTGRLIAADVGQVEIEEIDIIVAGGNYGWRLKEGSFFFNFNNADVSDSPFATIPIPAGFNPVDPVIQYDHDEGISAIGGFVYRGTAFPELVGKYVFGDFSTSFGQPRGRLFYGDLDTGEIFEFRIETSDLPLNQFVKGFGQDANGELYLLSGLNGGPTGTSGRALMLVRVPEPSALLLWLVGMCCWPLLSRRRS
jgi:glucose/arabinose dehydrogenase